MNDRPSTTEESNVIPLFSTMDDFLNNPRRFVLFHCRHENTAVIVNNLIVQLSSAIKHSSTQCRFNLSSVFHLVADSERGSIWRLAIVRFKVVLDGKSKNNGFDYSTIECRKCCEICQGLQFGKLYFFVMIKFQIDVNKWFKVDPIMLLLYKK